MNVNNLEQVTFRDGTFLERKIWRQKETKVWHHPTEPAVQWKDGDWAWFNMGLLHCETGPAVFIGGIHKYWLQGRELSREEWEHKVQELSQFTKK